MEKVPHDQDNILAQLLKEFKEDEYALEKSYVIGKELGNGTFGTISEVAKVGGEKDCELNLVIKDLTPNNYDIDKYESRV